MQSEQIMFESEGWGETFNHLLREPSCIQASLNGLCLEMFCHQQRLDVTYQTLETVFHRDIQILTRELKMRRATECKFEVFG